MSQRGALRELQESARPLRRDARAPSHCRAIDRTCARHPQLGASALVVSVRHTSTVTAVRRAGAPPPTGAGGASGDGGGGDNGVLWHLSSELPALSNFTFADGTAPFFNQHHVTQLANGHLLMIDNGVTRPAAAARNATEDGGGGAADDGGAPTTSNATGNLLQAGFFLSSSILLAPAGGRERSVSRGCVTQEGGPPVAAESHCRAAMVPQPRTAEEALQRRTRAVEFALDFASMEARQVSAQQPNDESMAVS